MTSTGRTNWMALDTAWWRRERVVELGEEFGATGPAVVLWLSCEAKAQNSAGWVKTGYRTIARGCFVELVTVCPIVSRSVSLGLLDDFKEADGRFTCRISGWKEDQERALTAKRKADQRARSSEESAVDTEDSPLGHIGTQRDMSRSVTECPPTGQDRTGQEIELPPQPPRGNRQRDLHAFDDDVQAYALTLGIEGDEGWKNVRGAIQCGARSDDDVLGWLRENRPDLVPGSAAA